MKSNAATAYLSSACACISFVMLVIATTTAWMIWGGLFTGLASYSFGMGPFIAGASWGATSFFWLSSYVYFSDLGVNNLCYSPNSEVVTLYGVPYGFCTPTGVNGTQFDFSLPSHIVGIQATIILSVILSFFACCCGYSLTTAGGRGAWFVAIVSLLAMVFAICAFALWNTWNLSSDCLSDSGCFVLVWQTADVLTLAQASGSPTRIRMSVGADYVLTVISFAFLLFSTVGFFHAASFGGRWNPGSRGDTPAAAGI